MTSATLGETGRGRRLVIWGVVLLLLAALIWFTFATGVGDNENIMPTGTGEVAALLTGAVGLAIVIAGLVFAMKEKTPAA